MSDLPNDAIKCLDKGFMFFQDAEKYFSRTRYKKNTILVSITELRFIS